MKNTIQRAQEHSQVKKSVSSEQSLSAVKEEHSLPLYGLPIPVQDYIKNVAEAYMAPIDFVLPAVLSAVGVACGNVIRLDFHPFYTNAVTWSMICAHSSANKSQPISEVLKPIVAHDVKEHKRYMDECANYEALKDLKGKDKKGEKPKEPICKQLMITDATPEARNQVLANNGRGILHYRDELVGLIADASGRYNKTSSDIQTMMSLNSGKSFSINRKGSKPLQITDPFYSIIGTIQPLVLHQTFNSPNFMSNGFLPRFAVWMPTELPKKRRKGVVKVEVNPELAAIWENALLSLINTKDDIRLPLSAEAQDLYDSYHDRNAELQEEICSTDPYHCSCLGKLQITVLNLCVCAQALHMAVDKDTTPISKDVMQWAIDICDYLEKNQRKMVEIITENEVTSVTSAHDTIKVFDAYMKGQGKSYNQSALAELMGVSRQTVIRAISKEK